MIKPQNDSKGNRKAEEYNEQQYQQEEYQENEYDNQEQEEIIINPASTKTMNLPVKDHVDKLHSMLNDVLFELEQDKKSLQMLRGDILNIGFQNNEEHNILSQYILDEITRLGKSFKKLEEFQLNEENSIKQQIASLNQDRIKIQQDTLILDHRTKEVENNVGFKNFFD